MEQNAANSLNDTPAESSSSMCFRISTARCWACFRSSVGYLSKHYRGYVLGAGSSPKYPRHMSRTELRTVGMATKPMVCQSHAIRPTSRVKLAWWSVFLLMYCICAVPRKCLRFTMCSSTLALPCNLIPVISCRWRLHQNIREVNGTRRQAGELGACGHSSF